MTWLKQAAKHCLAPVAVLVVVGGCGGETPTATALPSVPVKPEPLPETSAVQAPPIGLTSLPSAEEVQQADPGGRADPFAPLVGVEAVDAQDPTTGLALTGVLLVGDQKRAIVTTPRQWCDLCGRRWPLRRGCSAVAADWMVGAQYRCGARLHSLRAER